MCALKTGHAISIVCLLIVVLLVNVGSRYVHSTFTVPRLYVWMASADKFEKVISPVEDLKCAVRALMRVLTLAMGALIRAQKNAAGRDAGQRINTYLIPGVKCQPPHKMIIIHINPIFYAHDNY
jgi:hypothetical protein